MIHTDDQHCAACAEDDRRAKTLRGRLGSLLIDVGVWLGGQLKNHRSRQ